jgi:hypothetical protein
VASVSPAASFCDGMAAAYEMKLVVLGDAGVGKSSLAMRFTQRMSDPSIEPTTVCAPQTIEISLLPACHSPQVHPHVGVHPRPVDHSAFLP